jgi:O-antigen/teichoic acid export membrane protein
MSEMRASISLPSQAATLSAGRAATELVPLIVPVIIVRLIGQADVGLLLGVLEVYYLARLVMTMGFPNVVMYYMSARPIEERRFVAMKVTAVVAILGVVLGVFLLFAGFFGHEAIQSLREVTAGPTEPGEGGTVNFQLLAGLALYPLFDLPARIFPNLLIVEGRARGAAILSVVKAVVKALAVLVPIALGVSLWWVVASITATGLAIAVVQAVYMGVLYRGVRAKRVDLPLRQLFGFAFPLGLTDLVARLGNRLDKLIVFVLFAEATFAEFAVGAQLPLIGVIPGAIAVVYTPHFVGLFKNGDPGSLIRVWRQNIVKMSLVVVPIAMIFVVAAEEAAVVLFTAEYAETAIVLRLYAIYHLFRVATFGNVLVAAGKPGYVLQASLVFLAGNVIISIPAALYFGFWGPALGTVVAWVISTVFYCSRIDKATGIPIRRLFPMVEYLKTLAVAIVAGGLAMFIKLGVDLSDAWSLGIQAAIVLSMFCLLGSLTGRISQEDWAFVRGWIVSSKRDS